MGLNTAPRATEEADAIFERLTALFDGTPEAEVPALLARLVIVLAQHVGDEAVIEEAVRIARGES